jgi:glycosyltransferase involved in cell wall biosynthesis
MLSPRRVTPLLSIIVPVYNEATTVRLVIDRLREVPLPLDREIIVVDDGSTDGTGEVLRALEGTDPALVIVRAAKNGGKGAAVRLGLTRARGTIIAIQDADLELDPAELAVLVQPVLDGRARVVYGSRFLNGRPDAPFATIAGNRFLTTVTNVLYGASLTDMETCYKILAADLARSLDLRSNSFDLEPEITGKLLRRGTRILELPIHFAPRSKAEGKKIRWRDGVTALGVLLRERFRAGR